MGLALRGTSTLGGGAGLGVVLGAGAVLAVMVGGGGTLAVFFLWSQPEKRIARVKVTKTMGVWVERRFSAASRHPDNEISRTSVRQSRG